MSGAQGYLVIETLDSLRREKLHKKRVNPANRLNIHSVLKSTALSVNAFLEFAVQKGVQQNPRITEGAA